MLVENIFYFINSSSYFFLTFFEPVESVEPAFLLAPNVLALYLMFP